MDSNAEMFKDTFHRNQTYVDQVQSTQRNLCQKKFFIENPLDWLSFKIYPQHRACYL